MAALTIIGIVAGGQLLVAAGVIFFLWCAADRELIDEAWEYLASAPERSADEIVVTSCRFLPDKTRDAWAGALARQCPRASVKFCRDARLKGGVTIRYGQDLIDFSLSGRWKQTR